MSTFSMCWHSLGIALLVGCLSPASAQTADVVLKVQPGAGTSEIQRVLRQAREARAGLPAGARGAIRIVFPAGEYPVFEPVVLTPADSGTELVPTVLEAEVPGQAIWVGGLRLTPSADAPATGPWRYSLKGIRHRVDARTGGQFYIGEQRAELARQPNAGTDWFVQRPFTENGKSQFVASPEQAAWLDALSTKQRSRAIVHLMQSWTSGRHRIAEVSDLGVVSINPPANWAFHGFGQRQRFSVQNVRAALDAPGEWMEEDDAVLYLPRQATERKQTGYLAVNPLLLQMKGRAARGDWVEHVQIKGLAFAYAHHPLMGDQAQGDWQGAVKVGAAIELSGARDIAFSQCRIAHTGGYGLWLRDAVQKVSVTRCVLQDLGAGGVKVGEPEAPTPGQVATGFNRLVDNVVSDTGRDFPGAVGIWLGHTFGNVVQGNVVAHTTYTGISVGWQWGFGKASSGDNQIRNNVLWDIGQGRMADLAGIYTLGVSPGTVISGNLIRHVRGWQNYGAGAWGIYNDEGSSDIRVEGNAVIDAEGGAYHLHFGNRLRVAGNFFLAGGGPEVVWSNPSQTGTWQLEGNVLVPHAEQRPWAPQADQPQMQARDNLFGVASRAEMGMGCSRGCQPTALLTLAGLGQDVAQVDVEGLPPERRSALRRLVQSAQETVARARAMTLQQVLPAPGAPALTLVRAPERRAEPIDIQFATQAVGAHPQPLRYSPAARLELIAVDPGEAGSSRPGRCLRFVDGEPGLVSYDPHVFLDQTVRKGSLQAEFDVWIDARTEFQHEWRDDSQPYKVGPSLTLRPEGVFVGGRNVLRWRPQAWYRVKVSAPLGRPDASWELAVTADGKTTTIPGLGMGSAGWRQVVWMGWVSQATQAARTCLGSVKVTNND